MADKRHVMCEECGADKYIIPSKFFANKSKKFFCSRRCRGKFRSHTEKTGKMVPCSECGKSKYLFKSQVGRSKKHYCSLKCQSIGFSKNLKQQYLSGARDRMAITGRANTSMKKKYAEKFKTNPTIQINSCGYEQIYIPEVGWRLNHRYIWEQHNGDIPEGCVIHHKDMNRLNNNIDNLMCMPFNKHQVLHKEKVNFEIDLIPLYKKGLSDSDIGRILRVCRSTICQCRKRNGLIAHQVNNV